MLWHKKAESDNSLIDMGLPDAVQRGLDGSPTLPVVPSPWGRQPRRRRHGKPGNAVRPIPAKTPMAEQSNLPTAAVGNSPEGTGRMGLV